MTAPRISDIFAHELYERLVWFGRLRWAAAGGVAVASLAGRLLGIPAVWPSLLVIAGMLALYNVVLQIRLRLRRRRGTHLANLRGLAIGQMLTDLGALLVTVHFTGGVQSPVLSFVVFHMAIGTIVLATSIMYVIAAATCVAAFALYALEQMGVLQVAPAGLPLLGLSPHLEMLMLVPLVFGVVYLTHSVSSRVKTRSLELHQTTAELSDRTAELQRLLAEREELERRKSHYMRISAHQLRSPLGTIKTTLQVLVDGIVDPTTTSGRRLLRGAAERVDDLLDIVNDLLELAKIREGRTRAPWTRQVFLNQVLADIFDALEPYAQEREVRLVPDISGVARLDWGVPPDLVYAFENLIHNAIKYSLEGGQVRVRLRVEDEVVTVSVEDSGIGIPERMHDQIFMEFVRAPNAKQHTAEGTGLGLAIVAEAVRMHGGDVSFTSREGEGSVFVARLPLRFTPPEVVEAQDQESGSLSIPDGIGVDEGELHGTGTSRRRQHPTIEAPRGDVR